MSETHRVTVTFLMEEMDGSPTEVKATDLIDALRHLKGSEELWCEGGWTRSEMGEV